MLNIYLCRHGQNEDNLRGILNGHRDLPLTTRGIEQAEEIARKIQSIGLTFDAVFTSPLIRASHTAAIITQTLKLPAPTIMPELIERDFGIMTGKLQTDIEDLCAPDVIKTDTVTYFLNPEGAETFPDLIERAKMILKKIERMFREGNILLVSHGDIGKMIYCTYYNLKWEEVLRQFHFGNSELLLMSKDSTAREAKVLEIQQYNL